MREETGDLWAYHEAGDWVVITTNGSLRQDGLAVMGRGVAKDAAVKWPDLPQRLGEGIAVQGNVVQFFQDLRLICFPVKHEWRERANIELISLSLTQLVALVTALDLERIVMVRPGCGNGGLSWRGLVRALLADTLDDRFIVVHPMGNVEAKA